MQVGILEAVLRADTSQFTRGLDRAQSKMKAAGKKMQRAGQQLSMAVTLPATIAGGFAISKFANFEAAMNQVKAVSGATGKEMKDLEKIAREMGRTTKFSGTEAAEGLNFLSMAGFSVQESMKALPSTLDLAAAGNMQLGQSADIVSNIMTGFGRDAGQTEETVDILAKTFTSANTDLSQLGEAMSYAAPTAKALGMEIEEASAVVATLSDAGIQASRAGTGLRRMMADLRKKSDELGISIDDASGNMLPMTEIIRNLEEQGLASKDVIDMLGSQAGTALAPLMEKGADGLAQFEKELGKAGGTAKEVAETQMEGLKGATIELKAALSELAISFVKPLSGLLEKLTDKVKNIVNWISKLDPVTKRIVTVIGAIAAAAGPVLTVLGFLTTTIFPMLVSGGAAVGSMFAFLAKEVAIFNASLMANPVFAIVAGITALAMALVAAWKKFPKFRAIVKYSMEKVAEFFKIAKVRVVQYAKAIWDGIKTYFGSSVKIAKTLAKSFVQLLSGNFGQAKDTIVNGFKGIIADFGNVGKKAKQEANKELAKIESPDFGSILAKEKGKQMAKDAGYSTGQAWQDGIQKGIMGDMAGTTGLSNMFDKVFNKNEEPNPNPDPGKDEEISAYDELIGKLKRQNEEMKLSETRQKALSLARQNGVDATDEQIDKIQELIKKRKKQSKAEELKEQLKKQTDQIKRSLQTQEQKIKTSYEKRISTVQQAMEMEIITTQEGSELINELRENMRKKLEEVNGETKELGYGMKVLGSITQDVMYGFRDSLKAAFGSESQSFMKTFWNSFKKFIENLIAKLVAATIAALALLAVMAAIGIAEVGSVTKAVGEGGFKQAFKMFSGLQGLATGGRVTQGGVFEVGERGRETVYLPAGSAVVPNSKSDNGSGQRLVAQVTGQQLEFVLDEWKSDKDKMT